VINDTQRTEQWFKDRANRITGSVAGAALGVCPWRKPADVLRQMVRQHHGLPDENNLDGNPAIQYGNNHERMATLAFMKKTGLDVFDVGFLPIEHWSGASPDGITSDDAVLEIKCPFSKRKDLAPDFKPLAEQPHYYAQVQLEMMAAGKTSAYFAQYRPAIGDVFGDDYAPEIVEIETIAADPWWISENIPRLEAFYALYLSELENPAHIEPLRVILNEPRHHQMIDHIGELDDKIAMATEARKAAIADLIEMAGGKNADICGRKLTLVKRKGSISYAKALKALAPGADLSSYEGKESESWRLS